MAVVIHGSDDSGPVKLASATAERITVGLTSHLNILLVTTEQREGMPLVEDTMVYDTDLLVFCGVVNASGTLGWWSYSWVSPL